MKERPLLMSAPMVVATLDDTKTNTRRVMKPQPTSNGYMERGGLVCRNDYLPPDAMLWKNGSIIGHDAVSPYGVPGDRLWVRETWAYYGGPEYLYQREPAACIYRADQAGIEDRHGDDRWRPSIHMPRWASRITLEITAIRAERLHAISIGDILAEGVRIPATEDGRAMLRVSGDHPPSSFLVAWGKARGPSGDDLLRAEWASLWSTINGRASYDANPMVWVLSFKRVKP